MSEVIVCAEPETKDEAAEFVLKLGGRPHARSMRSSSKVLRNAQRLLVYLKGTEPSSSLRACLRQISKDKTLNVVIYSLQTNDQRAAELGRIVGQFRPKRTHICFDSEKVGQILRLNSGTGKTRALVGAALAVRSSPEAVAKLRKELNLTQVDFANSLGITPRTVQNWEVGTFAPTRQLRDLKELRDLLTNYIESDQLSAWIDTPNEAFHDHTPRELIREGKTRDLILEFRRMQSGEPL
jgi:transcriptional regulator with XRE-family HTH domain